MLWAFDTFHMKTEGTTKCHVSFQIKVYSTHGGMFSSSLPRQQPFPVLSVVSLQRCVCCCAPDNH